MECSLQGLEVPVCERMGEPEGSVLVKSRFMRLWKWYWNMPVGVTKKKKCMGDERGKARAVLRN